ncbi:MAG: hypothetical protein Q4G47_01760 [Lachnospiraceae bacterium]|nr:hypothetical protein [Lachnospiraceae bacterium]
MTKKIKAVTKTVGQDTFREPVVGVNRQWIVQVPITSEPEVRKAVPVGASRTRCVKAQGLTDPDEWSQYAAI